MQKNLIKIIKYIYFLLVLIPQLAIGQQGTVSGSENNKLIHFGAYNDFYSKYIWRGIILTNGAVFQPGLWVSLQNLSLTVSANINIDKGEKESNLDEVDALLSYGFEFGKFQLEPGVQLYLYPIKGEGPHTAEGYIKLAFQHKRLIIFTNHNIDFWNYKGSYYGEGGIGLENKLSKNISYSTSLKFAWSNRKFNESNYNISKQAMNLVAFSQSLIYHVNPNFSVTPILEIQSILDSDLRATYEQSTIFNLGISVAFEY